MAVKWWCMVANFQAAHDEVNSASAYVGSITSAVESTRWRVSRAKRMRTCCSPCSSVQVIWFRLLPPLCVALHQLLDGFLARVRDDVVVLVILFRLEPFFVGWRGDVDIAAGRCPWFVGARQQFRRFSLCGGGAANVHAVLCSKKWDGRCSLTARCMYTHVDLFVRPASLVAKRARKIGNANNTMRT